MAARKKKSDRTLRRRRRIVGALFLSLAIIIALFLAYSFALSRIVFVRRAVLRLEDLPPEFDGVKILYLSDIDIVGFSSAGRLFEHLRDLEPDILLLGGDYASNSLWDRINSDENRAGLARKRRKLFLSIKDFDAPLGKFGVAGDNDISDALAEEMALGGVALLDNRAHMIFRGGARLIIAGMNDFSMADTDYGALAQQATTGDCVIALAHDPSAATHILTAEAKGGGAWADVALFGHTHAGQMALGARYALDLNARQRENIYGWKKQNGVIMLTTSGVGCETVNLRFGTRAEAWLITLERRER